MAWVLGKDNNHAYKTHHTPQPSRWPLRASRSRPSLLRKPPPPTSARLTGSRPALGDPFLLSHEFEAVPGSEVAKQFGEAFAAKLGELSPGHWQGSVGSGYGVHLVFVGQRTEGGVPALEEVREAVRREWANAERLEANEKFYQGLLKRYTVTIERPQPADKLAAESGR